MEKAFENLRNKAGLVHCMTNYVTVNDLANIILSGGASPIMADDIDEMDEIGAISSALLLNIGTLNRRTISSMLKAGDLAKKRSIPIVFDPVGIGVSKLRQEASFKILNEVKPNIIKANASELKYIYNKEESSSGVDVDELDEINESNISNYMEMTRYISKKYKAVVVLTGPVDIISFMNRTSLLRNGNDYMEKITGAGCMLGALIGASVSTGENLYDQVVLAVAMMSIAGDMAKEYVDKNGLGMSSFRNHLIDMIGTMEMADIDNRINIERVDRDLTLYLVTDRTYLKGESLYEAVEKAILNGVTMVQLREKGLEDEDFLELAKSIRELTKKYNIPFLINDNVQIAKKVDADGVHLGQSDMDINKAREILGERKIIGISASNLKEAIIAEESSADYLGVGAIFKTESKDDADEVSISELKKIVNNVKIPVVAIGGINEDNIFDLKDIGISGVATISSILKGDISKASKQMRKLAEEVFYEGGNI